MTTYRKFNYICEMNPTMYINAITQDGELRVKSVVNDKGYKHIVFVDRSGGKLERTFKI